MHPAVEKHAVYVVGVGLFFLAVGLTDAYYLADAPDYVDSVVAHAAGQPGQFWDFGHLLWRPLGFLLTSPILSSTGARLEVLATFQWICLLAGLASTLILIRILRKLGVGDRFIFISITALVCSNAFLNFSQSGSPYVPGVAFLLLGLILLLETNISNELYLSVLAGFSFAFAISFWIAFLWVVPGSMLVGLLLSEQKRRSLFRQFCLCAAAFSLSSVVVFGLGAYFAGVSDAYSLSEWIFSAAHGNETRGVFRTVFGLARSFVFMANDGALFKQFLLGDPYNPVSIGMLVRGSLLKFGVFYLIASILCICAWKAGDFNRRCLIFAIISAAPLILVATLFDGGAVERYLPIYPALIIFFAVTLDSTRVNSVLTKVVIAIALLFALGNTWQLSLWNLRGRQEPSVARMRQIKSVTSPGDYVFLVNWNDDLINFDRSFPFHSVNRERPVRLLALVTPGLDQTKKWREEFAAHTLRAWRGGKNVWISKRALSPAPEPGWNWAEGTDRNVKWADFPKFFSTLETDTRLESQDEVYLIVPTNENKSMLIQYAEKYDSGLSFRLQSRLQNDRLPGSIGRLGPLRIRKTTVQGKRSDGQRSPGSSVSPDRQKRRSPIITVFPTDAPLDIESLEAVRR